MKQQSRLRLRQIDPYLGAPSGPGCAGRNADTGPTLHDTARPCRATSTPVAPVRSRTAATETNDYIAKPKELHFAGASAKSCNLRTQPSSGSTPSRDLDARRPTVDDRATTPVANENRCERLPVKLVMVDVRPHDVHSPTASKASPSIDPTNNSRSALSSKAPSSAPSTAPRRLTISAVDALRSAQPPARLVALDPDEILRQPPHLLIVLARRVGSDASHSRRQPELDQQV